MTAATPSLRWARLGIRALPWIAMGALSVALAEPTSAALSYGGDMPLSHGSRAVHPEGLPYAEDDAPRIAIDAWSAFGAEHGYSGYLSKDGRVLLLVEGKAKHARKDGKHVEATLALFDRTVPTPERAPDDPGVASERIDERTWSAGHPPLERDTAVLICVEDRDDYHALLDHASGLRPELADWFAGARGSGGFVLPDPLLAVWFASDPEQEEFSSENELVHRLTRLLVHRRYGWQPYWIEIGLAWYAELEIHDSVYVFPYRNGFVRVEEHRDWDRALRSRYKKRPADELRFDQIAGLERGRFDLDSARGAWGAIAFAAGQKGGALSAILEELRKLHEEGSFRRYADGRWERLAGYEVPGLEQEAVLRSWLGENFLEELGKAFARGKL